MQLYRSARLFTLGLALAGSCAAQDPQDLQNTNQLQRQMKQQRANKAQIEASRRAFQAKLQRRAFRAPGKPAGDAA
jgi:hypothetical protein